MKMKHGIGIIKLMLIIASALMLIFPYIDIASADYLPSICPSKDVYIEHILPYPNEVSDSSANIVMDVKAIAPAGKIVLKWYDAYGSLKCEREYTFTQEKRVIDSCSVNLEYQSDNWVKVEAYLYGPGNVLRQKNWFELFVPTPYTAEHTWMGAQWRGDSYYGKKSTFYVKHIVGKNNYVAHAFSGNLGYTYGMDTHITNIPGYVTVTKPLTRMLPFLKGQMNCSLEAGSPLLQ